MGLSGSTEITGRNKKGMKMKRKKEPKKGIMKWQEGTKGGGGEGTEGKGRERGRIEPWQGWKGRPRIENGKGKEKSINFPETARPDLAF